MESKYSEAHRQRHWITHTGKATRLGTNISAQLHWNVPAWALQHSAREQMSQTHIKRTLLIYVYTHTYPGKKGHFWGEKERKRIHWQILTDSQKKAQAQIQLNRCTYWYMLTNTVIHNCKHGMTHAQMQTRLALGSAGSSAPRYAWHKVSGIVEKETSSVMSKTCLRKSSTTSAQSFRDSGQSKSSKAISLTDWHSKARGDLFTHKESEVWSQVLAAQAVAKTLLRERKCHLHKGSIYWETKANSKSRRRHPKE